MVQKRVKILLSRRAEADLNEIYHYLAKHSMQALEKVDQKIFKTLRRLEKFPESGHWVPEFAGKKYREILVYHYRIIYRHNTKLGQSIILTIRHGKRYLPNLLAYKLVRVKAAKENRRLGLMKGKIKISRGFDRWRIF